MNSLSLGETNALKLVILDKGKLNKWTVFKKRKTKLP